VVEHVQRRTGKQSKQDIEQKTGKRKKDRKIANILSNLFVKLGDSADTDQSYVTIPCPLKSLLSMRLLWLQRRLLGRCREQ
jgi:hypothetical protein